MIQQEDWLPLISSIVESFCEFPSYEIELFGFATWDGALANAYRSARGYVRRQNRQRDSAFVDECIAEAYFIVTEMVMTDYDAITKAFPAEVDRALNYRMKVGYGLKSYFAYRAKQTISDQKKRGIIVRHLSYRDDALIYDTPYIDAMERLVTTDLQRTILEMKINGFSYEEIAQATDLNFHQIRKTLGKMKGKLRR